MNTDKIGVVLHSEQKKRLPTGDWLIGRRKDSSYKKSVFIRVHPWLKLLLLFVLQTTVFAHCLDEYLQATLVVIEPERVRLQINLTPGVAVAEQVLALIDRDGDGVISTNEAAAYGELFKRDLALRLDQRNLELKLTSSYFPGSDELRTGWGFVQMEFSAVTGALSGGAHKLTIKNRHLPEASVYLINAAQPASGSVQIVKQTRNKNQSTGEIEFTFQPTPKSARAAGLIGISLVFLVAAGVSAQRRRLFTVRFAPGLPRRGAHPLH